MDSAYQGPDFSFLLLCCLCLKPSFSLQCLQQHPQQCGPHAAGLSLPPHCVAQGHSPPSRHGDERCLYTGRKHGCMGLSGGRKDRESLKTRVIHSGFPFAFLAGELNPLFSNPGKGSQWDAYVLAHPSAWLLTVCPYCLSDPNWACKDKEMSRDHCAALVTEGCV